MKRILVTGSRNWTDQDAVEKALREHGPGIVVHGNCRGLDKVADMVAQIILGWPVEPHPADWKIGMAAGPLRNHEMVELGADVCIAFPLPGSKGTWDCHDRAKAAGIPCVVIEP